LLRQDEITIRFFKNIGTYKVMVANTVEETVQIIKDYLRVTPLTSTKGRTSYSMGELEG